MSTIAKRKMFSRWVTGTSTRSDGPWLLSRLRLLESALNPLYPAIEHPTPECGQVTTSSNTSITSTSYTDITDATLTLTPESDIKIIITGVFCVQSNALGVIGQTFSGRLDVNGSAYQTIVWAPAAANTVNTITGTWAVTLVSGTTYTLKLQGVTSNALSTFTVLRDSTALTYLTVPNQFKIP